MNLFLFLGRLDRQGSTENFCNFAKVHILLLRVVFLYLNEWNKYKIRVSVHGSIHTKKFINISMKKLLILALKCTFLGQKRLKHIHTINCVCQSTQSMLIVLGIYNFGFNFRKTLATLLWLIWEWRLSSVAIWPSFYEGCIHWCSFSRSVLGPLWHISK